MIKTENGCKIFLRDDFHVSINFVVWHVVESFLFRLSSREKYSVLVYPCTSTCSQCIHILRVPSGVLSQHHPVEMILFKKNKQMS